MLFKLFIHFLGVLHCFELYWFKLFELVFPVSSLVYPMPYANAPEALCDCSHM